MICSIKVPVMAGIICANFGYQEFKEKVCKGAWYSSYYPQGDLDQVLTLADLEDLEINNRVMVDKDPTQ